MAGASWPQRLAREGSDDSGRLFEPIQRKGCRACRDDMPAGVQREFKACTGQARGPASSLIDAIECDAVGPHCGAAKCIVPDLQSLEYIALGQGNRVK